MKRKLISTVIVLSMLVGICASIFIGAAEAATYPFTDVPGWASASVQTVFEKGIMNGVNEEKTLFGSNQVFTREQMVTTLYNMSGAKVETSKAELEGMFADGDKISTWAREGVAWAYANGITSGSVSGGKLYFSPKDPVTREQAAKFAISYLKAMGLPTEGDVQKDIVDINKVSSWAKEDVEACVKLGIINGDDKGYFNPKGDMTRVTAAVILAATSNIEAPESPSREPVYNTDPYDPDPDALGLLNYGDANVAEGLKISNAVLVDDAAAGNAYTATSLGNHGWVESRIVRNEYGTYVVMAVNERLRASGTYLGSYKYGIVESAFYLLKVTSTGFKKVYEGTFDTPHGGSCGVNLLNGEDGKIYVVSFTVNAETYFTSNLSSAAACLDVHEFDTKTDTIIKYTSEKIPFKNGPSTNPGYYQPAIDVKQGKIYAMFADGGNSALNYDGGVSWFVYDIENHDWEDYNYFAKTPAMVARGAYFHIYPDGNGGVYFLSERDMHPRDLEQHYAKYGIAGIKFATSSYIWDAVYLLRIADMHKEEITMVDTVFEPDYTNTRKFPRDENGQIDQSGAAHYDGGTSYLDSKGRLHVVCQIEGSPHSYSIYDVNDNFKRLRKSNLSLQNGSSYQFAITENADGDVFLVAVATGSRTYVEAYRVDVNATNMISESLITNQSGKRACVELTFADGSPVAHGRLSYTGTRNLSIQDNTIVLVTGTGAAQRKTDLKSTDLTYLSGDYGHTNWSGTSDTFEWSVYSITVPN